MRNNFRYIFTACFALVIFPFTGIRAQSSLLGQINSQSRVITTAVPFLLITPDARSGGLADAGVAISPDANSIAMNPAQLAFLSEPLAVSASYTPWLRELVPDINLSYLSVAKKIDNFSGFGASLRYFTLGNITFTDNSGNTLREFSPNEFALDLGYARKLSEHFSIGVAGRFIYSNLAGVTTLSNGSTTNAAIAFAGDISGYYTKKVKVSGYNGELTYGFNISNLGNKITYTDENDKDFLPQNLKVGTALHLVIDDYNEITGTIDLNKLLVPTPPVYKTDSAGNPITNLRSGGLEILAGQNPKVPIIQGAVQSFYDAPGGFKEEMAEIDPSIGFEYWYDKQFAVRAGYFYEAPSKGDRQFVTIGVGIKYRVIQIDFSYLVPATSQLNVQHSPLENTLQFTLQFFLGRPKVADPNAPAVAPGATE